MISYCIILYYRRLGGESNREIGFGSVAVRCEAVCARERMLLPGLGCGIGFVLRARDRVRVRDRARALRLSVS